MFDRYYHTPSGDYSPLYADMLEQTHLLIAGATGSGKSVVINGIINAALLHSPAQIQFVLIDPKRVELCEYRRLPHTIRYSSEPADMIAALRDAMAIVEQRYKAMQRAGARKFDGSHVYVIIDELADLMTTCKRDVMPLIQRLCQIGRAARVHVIAATQCPIAAVIPTPIKVNFDSRVALRTRSAQDSRNIIGAAGCETLPRYGQGYYMTAEGMTLYKLPMMDADETNRLIKWWMRNSKPKFKWQIKLKSA